MKTIKVVMKTNGTTATDWSESAITIEKGNLCELKRQVLCSLESLEFV